MVQIVHATKQPRYTTAIFHSNQPKTFPLCAGVSRPYHPPAPNKATEIVIFFFDKLFAPAAVAVAAAAAAGSSSSSRKQQKAAESNRMQQYQQQAPEASSRGKQQRQAAKASSRGKQQRQAAEASSRGKQQRQGPDDHVVDTTLSTHVPPTRKTLMIPRDDTLTARCGGVGWGGVGY